VTPPETAAESGERRRLERRTNARLGDLTLPELRRIVVTSFLFVIVLVLFLWMVRTVIIGAILGLVTAVYLRPVFRWIRDRTGKPGLAAALTLIALLIPVGIAVAYSYTEIIEFAKYLNTHESEIVARIEAKVTEVPFIGGENANQTVRGWVSALAGFGGRLPVMLKDAVGGFTVSLAIFIFTAFYVFTDTERIGGYLRGQVPPRYAVLVGALERNVKGVLYGAIYGTLVTQVIKTVVILVLLLVFRVPLAGMLTLLSFIIGFFPIVGSWSIYVPVAGWLYAWRGDTLQAILLIAIGFFINTIYISNYLRPKLAAERSRVLNFYWMFVGLVTGVYTFGLAGILLGPILIGLLKAIIDTVTAKSSWRLLDDEGDEMTTTGTKIITGT
jgi:predicted PurR-regulated permease PerM